MKFRKLRNVGLIDRILRLVGLHLIISLFDAQLTSAVFLSSLLSVMGLYLVFSIIFGIDPIYHIFHWNTMEKANDLPQSNNLS